MNLTTRHLSLLLIALTSTAQDEFTPGTHVPPKVGEVAIPVETVHWYYTGPDGKVPTLQELRGSVVLIHTWGYYCGPCMKHGVPFVVDLMRANAGRGLRTLSITVGVEDGQPDDHFVNVGREMGMDHPLGVTDGFGGMTPYLNMNKNKGLTWCFVIGRAGGVRWVGDPSIDDEEFLAAVRLALAEEAPPALEEGPPEPLAKAIAFYVGGDLGKARSEARKVVSRYAKKKESEEVKAVNAYGAQLLEAIDEHLTELLRRLEKSFAARDAEGFVVTSRTLLSRFAKTDAAKRVKALQKELKADAVFAAAVKAQLLWDELLLARPALFPARDDKANKSYAKRLAKYVDSAPAEGPGVARARELREAHEKALADKR